MGWKWLCVSIEIRLSGQKLWGDERNLTEFCNIWSQVVPLNLCVGDTWFNKKYSSVIRQKGESTSIKKKACQIFWKTIISYPLIRTRALFSCNTRFEIPPFTLLPAYYCLYFVWQKDVMDDVFILIKSRIKKHCFKINYKVSTMTLCSNFTW